MAITATGGHATGRQKWLGHLSMILFAGMIAGSFSLGSLIAPHIASAPLNALRFLIASILMGVAGYLMFRQAMSWPREPWRFLILGSLMGIYFVTMFIGLATANPVSMGAVFTLNPLLSAGFGYLILGQKPRPVVLVSLVIAAAGAIWVIFRGDPARLAAFDIGRGELIYLFGVICHSAYAALMRKFSRGEPVVVSTFWSLASTLLCITAFGLWNGEIASTNWTGLPPIVWFAIAYLSIFTTAVTQFLLQFASLRLPAAKVFAYGYLTPAFIIALEGAIGHGWAAPLVMAGALITVMGLVIMALSPDS